MPDQFSRTELLFGAEGMEKLKKARVAVFGIGGVGGYTAEALVRGGVGALDIYDDDKVCLTNLNRQLIATKKTVGLYKVDAAKDRLLEINPNLEINAVKMFYSPDTASAVDLSGYDYIADAVDTVTAKIELVLRADILGIPIISCMGAGNKLDPTAFLVADIYETSVCPLAKVMRSELKKRGIERLKTVYSKEPPVKLRQSAFSDCKAGCVCPPGTVRKCTARRQIPGSNSFVPAVAGLIIAGEIIKDITGVRG